MLDQLRAEHRLGDIEALVDAWVTPLVEEVSRHEPSYWARFNEQQLATMPLQFLDRFDSDLGARDDDPPLLVLAALFRRMAKTLTQLPGRQRPERVALTVRFFITGMASWERDAQAGRVVPGSLQSAAATLRDLAMALLAAPPQSGRRTQRG